MYDNLNYLMHKDKQDEDFTKSKLHLDLTNFTDNNKYYKLSKAQNSNTTRNKEMNYNHITSMISSIPKESSQTVNQTLQDLKPVLDNCTLQTDLEMMDLKLNFDLLKFKLDRMKHLTEHCKLSAKPSNKRLNFNEQNYYETRGRKKVFYFPTNTNDIPPLRATNNDNVCYKPPSKQNIIEKNANISITSKIEKKN